MSTPRRAPEARLYADLQTPEERAEWERETDEAIDRAIAEARGERVSVEVSEVELDALLRS